MGVGRASRASTALLVFLGAAVIPAHLSAQTVVGQVDGFESATRILVTLVDADGLPAASALSDPAGAFQLTAPGAGTYHLVADRVGVRSSSSAPFAVAAQGTTEASVAAPSELTSLTNLTAASDFRCVQAPDGDGLLAAGLAEALKALRFVQWSEDNGELELEIVHHQRDLLPDGRTVVRESSPESRTREPRVSARIEPAILIEQGFMLEDEIADTYQFFAPNPTVLTSQPFDDTHCWRLRRDGGEDLVGLAFEPLPERTVPEVNGVLWLDLASSHLLALEFEWNLEGLPANLSGTGGRTLFHQLPDGSWITPETRVRMPMLYVQRFVTEEVQEETWGVGAMREEVVNVLSISRAGEAFAVSKTWAGLSGTVTDTETGEPVIGARIRLKGTPYQTFTTETGRYDMYGFLDGIYTVVAEHPTTPSGLQQDGVPVTFTEGATEQVDLRVSTVFAMAGELCQGSGTPGSVVLMGEVKDSLSGTGLAGVPLSLRFRDPRRPGNPDRLAVVTTGGDGAYIFCDAPPDVTISIETVLPGHAVRGTSIMASGGSVRTDLLVPLATEQIPGGVYGIIQSQDNLAPIDGAEVRVVGTDLVTITNANGFYVFPEIPFGLRILQISHIGYQDREIAVSLGGGTAYKVDFKLTTEAIPIEGITVTAIPRRLFRDMVGMQHRMEMGFGDFLLEEDLARRGGGSVAHAIQGIAGARLVSSGSQIRNLFVVLRRAVNVDLGTGARSNCYPAVFVDGHRVSKPTQGGVGHDPYDLSTMFTIEVQAIEIYKGASSVPAEFGGGNAACGALVIWTKRG